ncbi:MAG: GGDEF domain-containing protein [Planctomycetes bacterium]|nr:GGDEF domain-containing protein [Planctomycetota bacterium]
MIAPLTLRAETLEWECLLEYLSPRRHVPWLVVPWREAPTHSVTALLRGRDALADWVLPPAELSETDARLQNLLRLDSLLAESRTRAAALEGQLVTDHKTGLYNDRHFRSRLREEFERTVRHGGPLTLLLLDLDDFKRINDTTSYEFGDLVLRTVGEILRRSVRSIDIPARIGGDEFAVLMPNTTLEEGLAVAHRIREASHRSRVETEEGGITIHHSQGVASFSGQGFAEPRELFLKANEAIKAAKRSGKDQVNFYDPRKKAPARTPAQPGAAGEGGGAGGQARDGGD